MDIETAARRWAETWSLAWPAQDVDAIAELYAESAVHRSPAFGEPRIGLVEVRRYLAENLPSEEDLECWFGVPIISGDRAALEWWATWTEHGDHYTFAGVTLLRFDEHGKVVDHRDYDQHAEGRQRPYRGW